MVTVESSLFMGDQCSLISRVTVTHEFMSPQTFNKVLKCLKLLGNKPVTHKLYPHVSRTNKILTIHKLWPQQLRMIPQ